MNAARKALAREKETLLMRSALARLRLRLAIRRVRASPAVRLASRLTFFARFARAIAAARIVQRALSNRPARKIPVASNS
jgi:hypothetical protein